MDRVLTPRAITAKILEASVAYRYLPPTGPEQILIAKLPTSRPADRDPDAADLLFAFEGGTGDRGIVGQPASQSLLGIVLARSTGPMSYDLHIAFRGSRSGKATRAFFEALSTNDPAGNPDWITDLGVTHIPAPAISTVGEVAEGFATSVQYTLPVIVECLKAIATAKGRAPRNIYVTGHSLGGALAQHFASAVLLGADYGPDGVGPSMPTALRFWPWKRLKLITFGAPRAGDEDWARALTIQKLQSEFYGAALPYDPDALSPTNPAVAPRLLDPTNPVAYRVLISTDPITTSLAGGKPVGETVYVNKDCAPIVGLPNPNAHEPALIRDGILAATGDSRTPTVAWRYLDMTDLNPARDDAHAGGPVEFEKLRDAVRRYYFDRNLWFDDAGFCDDFNTMRAIEGLPPAVCPPL